MAVTIPAEYRDLAPLGFPGSRAGDDGSLWVRRGETWRRVNDYPKGTHRVATLTDAAGRRRGVKVARLVLEAFRGRPPGGQVVRHRDDDPGNCRLGNLYWERASLVTARHAGRVRALTGSGTMAAVRANIAGRREQLGLTVADAARAAGLSAATTWRHMESSCGTLRLTVLLRACAVLRCTPNDLLPPDWRKRLAAEAE